MLVGVNIEKIVAQLKKNLAFLFLLSLNEMSFAFTLHFLRTLQLIGIVTDICNRLIFLLELNQ